MKVSTKRRVSVCFCVFVRVYVCVSERERMRERADKVSVMLQKKAK